MNNGWIKIKRKIINWEWYDDPNTKVVFFHCILRANYEDKKYRGKLIKRGQFLTGRKKFATQVGLSVQQVRTAWEKLESTNEITISTSNRGTLITVCEYDTYQKKESKKNKENNQQVNQQVTSKQPADNQQITTSKNKKNVKNKKKEKNTYTQEFEEFWETYDLKKGKWPAFKTWRNLTKSQQQKALNGVADFQTHFSSKQYTPRPRKYLTNRYWNDQEFQKPKASEDYFSYNEMKEMCSRTGITTDDFKRDDKRADRLQEKYPSKNIRELKFWKKQ